jgi:hypothetical protein
LDRFVSVDFGPTGASLMTPKLNFDGVKLVVNVDAADATYAKAELRDVNNVPIPGFTLDDCDSFAGVDDVRHTISFRGDPIISDIPKPVKIKFVMYGGKLYAFQFAECQLTADLTGDCRVNSADLLQMATDWLMVDECQLPSDITGDCKVDMEDLAHMSTEWLE